MFIVRRSHQNYAPLFNEFILIIDKLDESEALRFLMTWMTLTKTLPLNPKPYYLTETIGIAICRSEIKSTLNAHEFINYELKFDLNNPYKPYGCMMTFISYIYIHPLFL